MYERYCSLRDKKGYKDSDVARLSGVTKSTFSDWKSGRSEPKQNKLQKIADALDVSLEYLMTGKDVDIVQSALMDTEIRHNPLLADAFRKSIKLDGEKQKLVIELINKLSE